MRVLAMLLALWPMMAGAEAYKDDPGMTAAMVQIFQADPAQVIESYLFPSDADPAKATEAIAVLYTNIVGAAGNFNIDVGYLRREGAGYAYVGPVEVYGMEPREPRFLPDRIEITTTTLKDTDARCCPSGTSVWSIDRGTLHTTEAKR